MDGSSRDQSPSRSAGGDQSPTDIRTPRPSTPTAQGTPTLHLDTEQQNVAGPSETPLRTPKTVTIASPSTERRSSPSRTSAAGGTDRPPSPERKFSRPSVARRASSSHPHRGQEFSVDDREEEVEEDQLREQTQRPYGAVRSTTGYSSVRRVSALRRRTTGIRTVSGAVPEPVAEEGPVVVVIPEPIEAVDTDATEVVDDDDDDDYEPSETGSEDSFTLRDRQEAINVTHPFGIKIWKPSLYKKDRSVQKVAEGDIHSAPGERVGKILFIGNIIWVIVFGWWLSILSLLGGVACYLFILSTSSRAYGDVFFGLAWYILYPFGRFVQLEQDEYYLEEDEGEGRSISEYEQWQAGDIEEGRTFFGPRTSGNIVGRRRDSLDNISETDSLLGTDERTGLISGEANGTNGQRKRRLFGRGQWTGGRVLFFVLFYILVGPFLLLTSGICWLLVFTIPMARMTGILMSHLRRHPLALSFHSNKTWVRQLGTSSSVLVCTYRAAGWRYYKYTVDGTNIFFINLMALVVFVIFDSFVLEKFFHVHNALTSPAMLFTLALISIMPLAYFIGQAVASVSAQSSMGMASALNAFFATLVEVFLYCVALGQGKARLVEGSIIGSVLAGVLLMPGISMCAGAVKRKTQRFNFTSAQATVTLLLFAMIAVFAPTLFYQIYGTYELKCRGCDLFDGPQNEDCQRCRFAQVPSLDDKFYNNAVKPFSYISACFLAISYGIGCWFTLKTHSSMIWQQGQAVPPATAQHASAGGTASGHNTLAPPTPSHAGTTSPRPMESSGQGHGHGHGPDHGKSPRPLSSVKDSALYKRILGQSLTSAGVKLQTGSDSDPTQTVHIVPPHTPVEESSQQLGHQAGSTSGSTNAPGVAIPSLTREENLNLVRGVAEMAAMAATTAVQDVQRHGMESRKASTVRAPAAAPQGEAHHHHVDHGDAPGGHDAPNWSRLKSSIILCGATILYAAVAEILVDTVDVVLENVDIDEKFLGITLFALVPNTTEFLNAISFAIHGNVALSMEIGSAYALQVCLLQIPALVAYTAIMSTSLPTGPERANFVFTLIFPQWDLVTVILCVLLLSNVIHEGKSNYFKGSILCLTYCTVLVGFYYSGYMEDIYVTNQTVMPLGRSRSAGFIVGNKLGHAYEPFRTQ